MADINDLINQFYSVNDLKKLALPVDTTNFRIDVLKNKLRDSCKQVHDGKNKDTRAKAFTSLENDISDWAWLWQQDEGAITSELFAIRGIRGMARSVDKLIRQIKGEALQQHQEDLEDPDVGPDDTVLEQLRRKPIKEGGVIVGWEAPLNLALNARIIFTHDPRWRGRIRFDELAGIATIDDDYLIDSECYGAKLWLEEHYQSMSLPKNEIGLIIDNVGRNNPFHPIRERLNDLPPWDEKNRIENFFIKYFRAADTELHRAYGTKFLISCIARAFEPGCKLDTIPVLIGQQGANKSQALKILAFEDRYFTDTNIDLRNKDAFINIQGKWIMEMPECESLFRNGYNLSKSWITSQSDRYRAPFAQYATDHPRQCTFIATTNEQDLGFLADPTGNRRFWALLVGEVDLESLKSDMEQLWAEALFRYRAKETWWLSKNVELLRKYQNDRFALGDSWEDAIYMFLFSGYRNKDNFYVFTMDQVYDKLGIEKHQQNMRTTKRLAAMLRRYGAYKERVSEKGTKVNKWFWTPQSEVDNEIS